MNKIIPLKVTLIVLVIFTAVLSIIMYLEFHNAYPDNLNLNLLVNNGPISYPVSFPINVENNSTKEGIKHFTSSIGGFSIDLPSSITMTEHEERIVNGYTAGEVDFTFGDYVQPQDGQFTQGRLVISYGKPQIIGKGGACTSGYTSEIIAGQSVGVCEGDGYFSAMYFTNPNQAIEYGISTINLTSDQVKLVSKAVRETLKFE